MNWTSDRRDQLRSATRSPRTGFAQTAIIGAVILGLLLTLSIFVGNFASFHNIMNLLVQVAPIGIMACGVSFVMITGGIDISGPAVMATAAVIGADYMAKTGNLLFGPVLMVAIGAFLGIINGTAVAYLRMVPLVVTLSMMTISTGIVSTWTNGESVVGLSPIFSSTLNRTVIVLAFLSIGLVYSFILRRTVFGRWVYYIGNNAHAARVSGIPTKRALLLAYVICGVSAGIAGVMNTAALSSARPGMGPDTQILDVVSAAVIGGVSVNGGTGTIPGAMIGAILIIMINNVMNLLAVPDYFTGVIKGLIIIAAMAIEVVRGRATASASMRAKGPARTRETP